MQQPLPDTVEATSKLLGQAGYIADRPLATALFLALRRQRPLLLEGEAGVGKTEVARTLAEVLGRKLVRLQCYEGLDVAAAVYEWDYPRQMMEIRLAEATGIEDRGEIESTIFSERFLLRRPLLQALDPDPAGPPVLLIDELDRTDEPFEAFLLEILSDYQITVPEIGTLKADRPPITIITSNRTREIHDALRRRCFYHWVDYPDVERERAILAARAPDAATDLSAQVVAFVQKLRQNMDLYKPPGVAETLDWVQALTELDAIELDPQSIDDTLGTLLKYQDDIDRLKGEPAQQVLREVRQEMAAS
jgi:MoxR-like ATPase